MRFKQSQDIIKRQQQSFFFLQLTSILFTFKKSDQFVNPIIWKNATILCLNFNFLYMNYGNLVSQKSSGKYRLNVDIDFLLLRSTVHNCFILLILPTQRVYPGYKTWLVSIRWKCFVFMICCRDWLSRL